MDYAKINKKWWNMITPYHAKSSMYNLKQFKKGTTSLQSIELSELIQVKNKKMLHVLCHFGMDSLSWARKGAKVTGIDVSEQSIALAQKLSEELQIPAEFICSDVYALPKKLHKKFDIVFASYGVLLWLSDLKKFADIVNHFLKKGGIFYIVDLHPFTNMLNEKGQLRYDYFDRGPFLDDANGSYTNWKDGTEGVTYEWSHAVSDIINAFSKADLQLEFLHEFPFTTYNQFPGYMKKNNKGQYALKSKANFPLLFSLLARKR